MFSKLPNQQWNHLVKRMNSLLFITNDLQNSERRKQALLPFTYVGQGYMKGKMYRCNGNVVNAEPPTQRRGNRVIYGTVYFVENADHYMRALDALHDCSMFLLGKNHELDLQWREERDIVLIDFTSIDDFVNLRYTERTTVTANVYLANIKHPTIQKRIYDKNNVHRIQSGVHKAFIKQWEETHG